MVLLIQLFHLVVGPLKIQSQFQMLLKLSQELVIILRPHHQMRAPTQLPLLVQQFRVVVHLTTQLAM